ncbi:MAG: FAD-dependent oxidoreductase [Phycisphaerae bacterium]|nr:FAD-dependent oxidoreductase [Phycisphaerae bacterium]
MTNIPEVPQLGPNLHDAHPPMLPAEAVLEAEACLQCGGPCAAAPCVRACPAGIDIPGFIHDIAEHQPVEAARKIFADNILGGTCARVCPVQVLCEGSCVLLKEGRRAIQIGRLQRHATDAALDVAEPLVHRGAVQRKESVAVIGAGPAGLGCAAELAQRGFQVTIYESRDYPGGLITRGIAPYKQQYKPLPEELMQIRALGVDVRFGVTVGREITVDELRSRHQAIFLGVGMGDDMPAKIPGENLPGVWESLKFIEELKLGNPGSLHVGPRVAVIGGGNTAIDVAREAAMLWTTEVTSGNTAVDVSRQARMLGAREVMMLYRRSESEMPAFAHEITAAKDEGVRIVPLVAPIEFLGHDRVTGVRCIRMRLGAPDASGRPRPEPIPGSEFTLEVETVIKAIGQKPHSELLALFGVEMKGSVVRTGDEMETSAPGVFAGGDCINGGSTVVQAVSDGRKAAKAIARFLLGQAPPRVKATAPARVESEEGTIRHFQLDYRLTTAPKLCKGCNVCVTSCPTHTLKLDSVNQIEVKDPNTCVFCGLCEARCPDFAIWIVKGEAPRARPVELEEVAAS